MNFIYSFLLFLLIGGIASLFLPFWIIVPIGLLIGYFFSGKSFVAFGLGFLSQFIVWIGTAAYFSFQNEGLLLEKMASLFGGLPPFILLLIIGFIGGMTGGLSSWTGQAIKSMTAQKKAMS